MTESSRRSESAGTETESATAPAASGAIEVAIGDATIRVPVRGATFTPQDSSPLTKGFDPRAREGRDSYRVTLCLIGRKEKLGANLIARRP